MNSADPDETLRFVGTPFENAHFFFVPCPHNFDKLRPCLTMIILIFKNYILSENLGWPKYDGISSIVSCDILFDQI